jgi:thioredoxin-like negative regulator of GroEL
MSSEAAWTVVCLCAEWCATCRDYRQAFEAYAARTGAVRHVWIDIEDAAGWLGDLDVETLPTLLVLRDAQPLFFGAVLPHVDVIERTLRALRAHGAAAAPVPPEFRDAVARLTAHLAAQPDATPAPGATP